MCVIIVKPANETLSEEDLKSCYKNNPDGIGWMYAEDGKVIADKFIPNSFEEVQEVFDKLHSIDAVIHFRYLTTGDLSVPHCHPFRVLRKGRRTPDMFMMHNGTFPITARTGENDTIAFKNQILKPVLTRDPSLITDDNFLEMVAGMDSWSRLCFLTGEGVVVRTRAHSWVKRGECLLSNSYSTVSTHREKPKTSTRSLPVLGKKKPEYKWIKDETTGIWEYVDKDGNVLKRQTNTGKVVSLNNLQSPLKVKDEDTSGTSHLALTGDALLNQDVLKSMSTAELEKWIEEDETDVVNTLLLSYSAYILGDKLADLGVAYGFDPSFSDVLDFVQMYPEEVIDFVQTGYYKTIEEYTEYFNESH